MEGGGGGETGGSTGSLDGDRGIVIQRVLSSCVCWGATLNAGNVFGAARRKHNGTLTVDSW